MAGHRTWDSCLDGRAHMGGTGMWFQHSEWAAPDGVGTAQKEVYRPSVVTVRVPVMPIS